MLVDYAELWWEWPARVSKTCPFGLRQGWIREDTQRPMGSAINRNSKEESGPPLTAPHYTSRSNPTHVHALSVLKRTIPCWLKLAHTL